MPDDLSKLTVAKLKDALKKRGLDVAGLKADLVARLQSAVDAENKAGPGSPKSPPTSKSPRQSKGAGDEDGKSPRTSTREPSPERKSPRASGGKGGKRKRDSEPSEPASAPSEPAASPARGKRAKRDSGPPPEEPAPSAPEPEPVPEPAPAPPLAQAPEPSPPPRAAPEPDPSPPPAPSPRVVRDDDAKMPAPSPPRPAPVMMSEARAAAAAALAAELENEPETDADDAPKDATQLAAERRERAARASRECPYLDTVNRSLLDFDFEKCCGVSLSPHNVYACLMCGKYFQGRGPSTHAYTHALEATHHVFMNLDTGRVYCLPDMYEVVDASLDDIRHVLNPKFTQGQIAEVDDRRLWSAGLDGTDYLTGAVGLNNLKATDYVNVVLQSVMRVGPVRDFFLAQRELGGGSGGVGGAVGGSSLTTSPLARRFGELTRKIWNSRNFKGQVSPHEFMQAVLAASNRRFAIDKQSDPVEFLSWLLNTLNADLSGKKRGGASVVSRCFQGELEVTNAGLAYQDDPPVRMPFFMLSLDLPAAPLFQDAMEKNTIPQVPLFQILRKFDGETEHEVLRPEPRRKRYKLARLPKYLIVHHKRFTKNNFFVEKNPTIVTFPVKNLQLSDHVPVPKLPDGRDVPCKYNLVANVTHEGKPESGAYRAAVWHKADGNWYDTEDLTVKEVLPQQVVLTETYLQIYELDKDAKPGEPPAPKEDVDMFS